MNWDTNRNAAIYKLLVVCQFINLIYCAERFRVTKHTQCRLSKNILKYVVNVSINECVQECRARQKCAFLNYRRRTLLCELYTDDDGASEVFITNSVATGPCVYVHRDDIQNSNTADPCACADSETCDVDTKQCSVTECESPDVGHLALQGNTNDVGSLRKYRCGGGSYNVTQCMNTGLWDPLMPMCSYTYQGCQVDNETRQIRGNFYTDDHMTLELCSQLCSSSTYIGLQYYRQCFCGNTLHHDVPALDSECRMPCAGNQAQMCGGYWRNSLYKLTSE